MGETSLQRDIRGRQRSVRVAVVSELERVRRDENVSLRRLGRAVGVDQSHLARVVTGDRSPSWMPSSLRPPASDTTFQSACSPRPVRASAITSRRGRSKRSWRPSTRAGSPASRWPSTSRCRGVIDVVLQDRTSGDIVAAEAHSALHAVERQLRWAGQKADALPSARGWPWSDRPEPPRIGRLLILRSSRAMRDLVATVPRTFATAYPARTSVATDALDIRLGALAGRCDRVDPG